MVLTHACSHRQDVYKRQVVPSLGLTTAQIALYPLSVWALWALTRQRLWARAAHLLPVPALLLFMLLWVLLGTAIVSPDASTLSLVAQLDAYKMCIRDRSTVLTGTLS